jgi:tetratricopeptide (TPR) repeat protein
MIALDVNDYEGYAGKANIFYKLRNYAQALPLYEMATAKNPAYMPLYETGMCKYASDNKDEGVSDFKKYCEIYPQDDMTNYTVGRLLYDLERDNEAWYYAEKAIEINQTVPEYFMLRGYLNHVKKSWDAAISDYTKVIDLNGEGKGEAYYKRGLCKAEKFAVTKDESYRSEFCSDLRMAKSLGISEGDDYLNEFCN